MRYTPEQIKDAGLDDFRVFLVQVWAFLGLPDPTPVQLDIAWWLQHGPKFMVIMAFRGVGKSWITATFALWNLFRDPDHKIEVVSAGGDLANDISKFVLQLIREMPMLQHLEPPRDASSSKGFKVKGAKPSKDPSFKSAGITGQITGTRADLIIGDDIEIPKNSFTHHLRSKLKESTKEFAAILKPEPHARIIYLGTPQVEESLYTELPRRGYTVLVWPAEVPENPEVYGGTLAPFVQRMIANGAKAGEPVEAVRFPRSVLDEKKAEYGRSGYALQFMLDTNPATIDKHPLKLSDLIVTDLDPEIAPVKMVWGRDRTLVIEDLPPGGFSGDVYHRPAWKSDEMAKYGGAVMAIDPSGRGKDELAYAIVKHLHSTLYLVDVGGFRDGFSEQTLNALAAAAARHGVTRVIAETNYGGGMFNELFKPYLTRISAGVCEDCKKANPDLKVCSHSAGRFDEEWKGWSVGQKEVRILDTLEPVIQQHRLVVDRRVIERDIPLLQEEKTRPYSLVFQMTRMERTKGALAHDDRIEAVAMACEYWTKRMGQDRDKVVQAHKDALMDEEIRKFMAAAGITSGRRKHNYINLSPGG
jgi:hypothetical protein